MGVVLRFRGRDLDAGAVDFFCGAGGSTAGLKDAGLDVILAANHWDLALETHEWNHPDVVHDLANLSLVDFRYYPSAFMLWASPECTTFSRAAGRQREISQMTFGEAEKLKKRLDRTERSRATMWDVWRYAEIHRPPVVAVENVEEMVRYWEMFPAWRLAGENLGYQLQILSLNSAIFWPTPQLRNRIYIIGVQKGCPMPDFDFRPPCWCPHCERTVEGVQSWRNLRKPRFGNYAEQYDYRCAACAQLAWPWTVPAAAAIDWTIPGIRIGDRTSLGMRPLVPGTMRRLEKGLAQHGFQAVTVPVDHSNAPDSKNPRPVALPLPAQTARSTLGLSVPFLHQAAGNVYERDGSTCRSRGLDTPLRTQTATGSEALVAWPGGETLATWIAKFYGTSHSSRIDAPLGTISADGNHHGLVQQLLPPGVDPASAYVVAHFTPGWTRRADSEPLGAITARDHHSLLQIPTVGVDGATCPPLLVPYYGNGTARPVTRPMNTLTSRDRNGLAVVPDGLSVDVMDCLFRMLEPEEHMIGMGFQPTYRILGEAKRDRTAQAGNAVTPPVSRAIGSRILDAFAA